MDKFYYLITEGMKNVWRHKMTAFTAIMSLFISLFIVGLLATAGDNTHKVLQYLRSKYKIEVFFKQDVSNEEAVGLIHQIKKIKGVRTATIIEKEDAVRIFKDQFGGDRRTQTPFAVHQGAVKAGTGWPRQTRPVPPGAGCARRHQGSGAGRAR